MKDKIKLTWDGEKIRQSIKVEDTKFTPKQILESIDGLENSINQQKQQKVQLENNLEKIGKDIIKSQSALEDLKEFEEKCLEINKAKLLRYIEKLTPEIVEATNLECDDIIDKDPNALTSEQKTNIYYVTFQRKLATHKKVADNICKRVITSDIYEKPVFENPFLKK